MANGIRKTAHKLQFYLSRSSPSSIYSHVMCKRFTTAGTIIFGEKSSSSRLSSGGC